MKRPRIRNRWRCWTCGLELDAWAPMERHVDQEHEHGRIEIVTEHGKGTK